MNNLLMGLDVIFPVFFVLIMGYFLKYKNIIDDNFISKSTTLVFYIALPVKLFLDIKNSEVFKLDISYTVYLLIGVLLIYFGAWIIAALTIKDKKKLSAFAHCAYRSNFVYIGIPILERITDNIPMDSVIVVMVFGLTLYNILAIVLLTYYNGDKLSLKSFVVKILKNPMIISIVLGLIFKIFRIPIYQGLENGGAIIGKLCTPLSLILIGGNLDFSKTKGYDNLIIFGSIFIKDVLGALIMIPLGMYLGFTSGQLVVAYIFFASPCATNCFIMGKQMGSDAELSSKIVTASFVFSVFTLAIGTSMLKSYGII